MFILGGKMRHNLSISHHLSFSETFLTPKVILQDSSQSLQSPSLWENLFATHTRTAFCRFPLSNLDSNRRVLSSGPCNVTASSLIIPRLPPTLELVKQAPLVGTADGTDTFRPPSSQNPFTQQYSLCPCMCSASAVLGQQQ